jgi:hypothetical protein
MLTSFKAFKAIIAPKKKRALTSLSQQGSSDLACLKRPLSCVAIFTLFS